ncbi:uncharacterized protein LOC124537562 [Vanessa cardui]|uniref:uncharacterized protein LOC124537562 n=1 Tax=Vanessa cardui TaxID=171605 RepID=UPI001F1300DE|nr:uncharacterized protein LOC124537562 [Vanessa cardui]
MFTTYGAFTMIWITIIPSIIINANDCGKDSIETQSKAPGQKLSYLESTEQVKKERKRKRCCPYNFDGKLCRTVGDRVLCGYNRNVGGPENDEDLVLQNGCRIRKGRLECGYNEPPFLNSRRPPVSDYALPEETDNNLIELDVSSKEEKIQKLNLLSTDKPKLTTRCVEIKERIVCRQI